MKYPKDWQPWGRSDLMVTAAFRYCLGRRTYIVGDCADWLVANWSRIGQPTRALIKRELDDEFGRDDAARLAGDQIKPLGDDCDRREWERVRALP